jgi:ADP-ribosyl-[dinitrogen reductase] hydrolase
MGNNNKKLDRYKGCLKGLAIGDVLGAPFEFLTQAKVEALLQKNVELDIEKNSQLGSKLPVGFYTDDTSQMICLAESLLEKGFDIDDQFKKYKDWYLNGYATPNGDKSFGIGQQTLKKLLKDTPEMNASEEEWAGGNGGLMRCAPIALYYQGDYSSITEKSILSCRLTHNNKIAESSCVILNILISLIIDGVELKNLLPELKKLLSTETIDVMQGVLNIDYLKYPKYLYPISGYSLDTLRIAIWALFNASDFDDAMKKVIRLGADTDTFGAVTGALLGAYYGYDEIPEKWKQEISNYKHINQLANDLYERK